MAEPGGKITPKHQLVKPTQPKVKNSFLKSSLIWKWPMRQTSFPKSRLKRFL